MGVIRRLRHIFHSDWCSVCYATMEETTRRLFALPTMYTDHYISHSDASYYIKNLIPVSKKADIPTGLYACGLIGMRCPECGHKAVLLSVFLPVRDMEKPEESLLFEHGELDGILYR